MPSKREAIIAVVEAKRRLEPPERTPTRRSPMPRTPSKSYGTGLLPTRKWFAATVTGLATIGVAWAEAGDWSQTLTITAIGFAAQRLVAWLIPNDDPAPTPTTVRPTP
jgi:hypothetical protein